MQGVTVCIARGCIARGCTARLDGRGFVPACHVHWRKLPQHLRWKISRATGDERRVLQGKAIRILTRVERFEPQSINAEPDAMERAAAKSLVEHWRWYFTEGEAFGMGGRL